MNMTKILPGAIALGLLASASAQADLVQPSEATGSSLFVTVFDTTNNESFTTDLNLFYNHFVDNSVTLTNPQTAGAYTPLSYSLDMSVFADNDPANLLFNVYAGDSMGGNGSKGIVLTGASPPTPNNSQFNAVNTAATQQILVFNQNCGVATGGDATGCAGNYGDEFLWGSSIGGDMPNGTAAGFDQALAFYQIAGANTPGSTALATVTPFADANGAWNWLLAADGTLTFSGSEAPAPVPLPAALWLLISGLAGVGALGRRSNQKA